MNLASIDLNLLVALDALLAEAHVGRAARRIGRSQPAVSHSLKHLRGLLGDPLLVKIGSRMELTPRALELRAMLPEALERIHSLLVNESFQPSTSTRSFRIVLHDHLADVIVPGLLKRIHAEAPLARLEVLPWQSPAAMNAEQLRSIDLCISCLTADLPAFERTILFTDTESVVVRRGHPRRSRMRTLEAFLEARHVAVVPRGRQEDTVDTWLREEMRDETREEKIERRIGLVVPSYLQALHAVSTSDLVAFVPTRLAQALAGRLSLAVLRPPVDPGEYEEFLLFPRRKQRDPAALWLRDIVIGIGRRSRK